MADALATGFAGLAILFALIAIRIPIAYSMILVGGIGTMLLTSPAVFMNQLKTLAFGQFAIYDLSVVPMFVLMGALATRAGLSQDLFRAATRLARLAARRRRDGGDRRLRRLRCGLRLVARHRLDHGPRRPARARAQPLLRRRSPPARSPPAACSAS
jgi:hypothetical protein